MKRFIIPAAVFFTVALGAQAAMATSPHFISASGTVNADGSLTVNFKEAGLGTNQNINYQLTANATATWVCVNNGSKHPQAANKTQVAGPVSATGSFNSGKNGQVTASLTAQPPQVAPDFCPNGQTAEIASVTYTDVVLTDTTNTVSITVGTVESGCLLPNVRGAC